MTLQKEVEKILFAYVDKVTMGGGSTTCESIAKEILSLFKKTMEEEVIGGDMQQSKNYSILNPYRRIDEENREKLNTFRASQRTKLNALLK